MKSVLIASLLVLLFAVGCSHVTEVMEPAFMQAGPTPLDSFSTREKIDLPEFQEVYFDFDSAQIRKDSRQVVEANAKWLLAHPEKVIRLEGHCDHRGSSAYNLKLGERRTASVKELLMELGIPENRIGIISHGSSRDLAVEKTELHRKVVFKIAD